MNMVNTMQKIENAAAIVITTYFGTPSQIRVFDSLSYCFITASTSAAMLSALCSVPEESSAKRSTSGVLLLFFLNRDMILRSFRGIL